MLQDLFRLQPQRGALLVLAHLRIIEVEVLVVAGNLEQAFPIPQQQ